MKKQKHCVQINNYKFHSNTTCNINYALQQYVSTYKRGIPMCTVTLYNLSMV